MDPPKKISDGRFYLNVAKKYSPEITPTLPSPLEGEG
jgi:hypothetical protein